MMCWLFVVVVASCFASEAQHSNCTCRAGCSSVFYEISLTLLYFLPYTVFPVAVRSVHVLTKDSVETKATRRAAICTDVTLSKERERQITRP